MAQGSSARQATVERKSQSSFKQKARGTTPLKGRRAGGSGGSSPRGNTARRSDSRSGQILYWAGGTVISAIFVLPLLFETLRSFQPESVVTEAPTAKTFGHLSLSNYQALLGGQDDILRNVINSLIVAVGAALLTALVATLAGYGFALFRFRGSGIVFGLVLVAFMIPFQAVLTPLFIEMHDLHLLNNLLGLALFYTTFNLPVGVYVMRNSFLQVPRELVDAARVDGASVMKTLTSVFRPLIMPGIATAALYAFLFSWTEFLGALSFLTNDSLFTLPVALSNVETGTYGSINYGLLLAGAVIAMVPCIVVYVGLQRYYVRGLVSGALKG
jgi:multiple sugar transport system permease protein